MIEKPIFLKTDGYQVILTPKTGYKLLEKIIIKVNGIKLTNSYTYDKVTSKISIFNSVTKTC